MTAPHRPLVAPTQLDRLDAAIATAIRARSAAATGNLFASDPGQALINALYDLTEVEELYDLAADIAHGLGNDDAFVRPAGATRRFLTDMARAA